jgi:hypothetical protein
VRRALRPLRFRSDRSPPTVSEARETASGAARAAGERCDPLARSRSGTTSRNQPTRRHLQSAKPGFGETPTGGCGTGATSTARDGAQKPCSEPNPSLESPTIIHGAPEDNGLAIRRSIFCVGEVTAVWESQHALSTVHEDDPKARSCGSSGAPSARVRVRSSDHTSAKSNNDEPRPGSRPTPAKSPRRRRSSRQRESMAGAVELELGSARAARGTGDRAGALSSSATTRPTPAPSPTTASEST